MTPEDIDALAAEIENAENAGDLFDVATKLVAVAREQAARIAELDNACKMNLEALQILAELGAKRVDERDEARARVAELEAPRATLGCIACYQRQQELSAARAVVEAARKAHARFADREAFVFGGPRVFAMCETVLGDALAAYDAATKPTGSETDE